MMICGFPPMAAQTLEASAASAAELRSDAFGRQRKSEKSKSGQVDVVGYCIISACRLCMCI